MSDYTQADWAREVPRKKISTPYNFSEKMSWIKNNLFGPSKKYKKLTKFIPQSIQLNEISPNFKLGFIGDIMKMNKRDLEIGNDVKQFFHDVDYLIGNFEGTISKAKKVFMAQEHDEKIIAALKSLFPPEKTVLTNANNHSGDFGWNEFNRSYELLKKNGFMMIGRRNEPNILLEETINVSNITKWSNQPCQYIPNFDDVDDTFNPNAKINILSPHWGYESQLYPNPKQIEQGKKLLEQWEIIVGHHSHCPQPITSCAINGTRKMVAYSLGDFCIGLNMKKYRCGIVVKAEIGPNSRGKWQAGKVEWKFSHVNHVDKRKSVVEIKDSCKFFPEK